MDDFATCTLAVLVQVAASNHIVCLSCSSCRPLAQASIIACPAAVVAQAEKRAMRLAASDLGVFPTIHGAEAVPVGNRQMHPGRLQHGSGAMTTGLKAVALQTPLMHPLLCS